MAEMRWFDSALDNFIAPKLSKLTACGAAELPVRDNLLPEFVLNSIFTIKYGDELKKNTLNLIRHVDHATLAYTAARTCLLDYLAGKPGQHVSAYFNAVTYFETHVSQLNMARWLSMRIARPGKKRLFKRDSGCFDERLQEINNRIKHLHEKISEGILPEKQSIIMWLSNDGLETEKFAVTFSELVGVLADCHGVTLQIARELPKRLVAQKKQEAAGDVPKSEEE